MYLEQIPKIKAREQLNLIEAIFLPNQERETIESIINKYKDILMDDYKIKSKASKEVEIEEAWAKLRRGDISA